MKNNITYIDINKLSENPRNSKIHPDEQIAKLMKSITEFGFNIPILIDKKNMIIAGHARFLAAKALHIDSIPSIRIENLTDDQIKAYSIADNKLTELGEWDYTKLSDELEYLNPVDIDAMAMGFDYEDFEMLNESFQNDDDILSATKSEPSSPSKNKKSIVFSYNIEDYTNMMKKFKTVMNENDIKANAEVIRLLIEHYNERHNG